jgi:hypothetical protein
VKLRSFAWMLGLLAVGGISAGGCSAGNSKAGGEELVPDSGNAEAGGDTTGFDPDTNGGLEAAPEASLDPEKDNDGDGYLFKEDCDDTNPDVNPGAYEVAGDGVDNDCDGAVDNPEPDCDTSALKFDSAAAGDFAKALGLCRTTTAGATGKDKRWGVIKAELLSADGKGKPDPIQYGIERNFGTNVKPRQGASLIVLSSGTARLPTQSGFITPLSPSWSAGSSVTPPPGFPKNATGCPDPFLGATANDSSNLKLTIRVPTNAKAFKFNFDFYSSEYITFVCSAYNDSFVALLDTKAPIDPKFNKNISFDVKGNPISVNNSFFEVCTPGSKGGKSFACAKGTKELEGTGFWDPSRTTENGATSWLETKAPVVPGETITIQFMIWDTGDHILDSTVLVDNFQWDAKPTTGPVTDRPK